MAVYRWLDVALGDGRNFGGRTSSVILSIGFTLIAGFYLATAFLLRRRQQTLNRPM